MKLAHLAISLLVVLMLGACAASSDDETEPDGISSSSDALSSISCSQHTETGYTNGSPTTIEAVTVDGKLVQKNTADAYYVMAEAANKAGVHLQVISGFRSMSEQQYLYHCYTSCSCNSCNLAAKPGYSNHQSGHALDLNTSAPGVYSWLENHAASYGFKRTVPSEIWHWEWWGGGPGGGPCGGGGGGGGGGSTSADSCSEGGGYCTETLQCDNGHWIIRADDPNACTTVVNKSIPCSEGNGYCTATLQCDNGVWVPRSSDPNACTSGPG